MMTARQRETTLRAPWPIRLLCLVAVSGGLVACRDLPEPEPFRPYEEYSIMPDENGFLSKDRNDLGLQGHWFSFHSLDSTIEPEALSPFLNDGRKLCTRGVAAQVLNGNFDLYYGAAVGFDLCYSDDGDVPADFIYTLSECPFAPGIDRKLAGIAFDITAGDTEDPEVAFPEVRVMFREWNRDESAYVPLTEAGSYRVLFRDAGVYYAADADQRPGTDVGKVHSIHFQIPTVESHATPFDFCLSNIRALVDPRDVIPGQSTDTDGDTGSDVTCEEAYPDDDAGVDTTVEVDLEWVLIPGGTFVMGTSEIPSEEPRHTVHVDDFEMLRTEVTVTQYQAFMEDTAQTCLRTGDWDICNVEWAQDRANYPANCVTWHQARAFCAWAGGRLPSEAEWEYAARSGGEDIPYPWGNAPPTCERAMMNEDGEDGCGTWYTAEVCQRPDGNTAQDLCDMAGNVWEWVEDWYHESYDDAPEDGSAWVVPATGHRVKRGGGHASGPNGLRTTSRSIDDPSRPRDYGKIGFRCVR